MPAKPLDNHFMLVYVLLRLTSCAKRSLHLPRYLIHTSTHEYLAVTITQLV